MVGSSVQNKFGDVSMSCSSDTRPQLSVYNIKIPKPKCSMFNLPINKVIE